MIVDVGDFFRPVPRAFVSIFPTLLVYWFNSHVFVLVFFSSELRTVRCRNNQKTKTRERSLFHKLGVVKFILDRNVQYNLGSYSHKECDHIWSQVDWLEAYTLFQFAHSV